MTGVQAPALRLALLVDCDNVPAACAGWLMEDLSLLGQIAIAEAFGDFQLVQTEAWSSACQKHEILEIQIDSNGRGKNAADIAITVRVMDLVHENEVDGVALVSRDSDFVPLLEHLRAKGTPVFVFASKHARERLRDVASLFVRVENLLAKHPANSPRSNVKPLRRNLDFLPHLKPMMVDLRDEEGWVTIEHLHEELLKEDCHFDPRDFGYRQLVDLCATLPRIVVEHPVNGELRVRVRMHAERMRRK